MPDLSDFPEAYRHPPDPFNLDEWLTIKTFRKAIYERNLRRLIEVMRRDGYLGVTEDNEQVFQNIQRYRKLKFDSQKLQLQDELNILDLYPEVLFKLRVPSSEVIRYAIKYWEFEHISLKGVFWWNGYWWLHKRNLEMYGPLKERALEAKIHPDDEI